MHSEVLVTCRLSPIEQITLAQEFYEATVDTWGTDEVKTVETLCLAKQRDCVREFNQYVYQLITPDALATLPKSTRNEMLVARIFKDELSGVRYTEAKDCLVLGYKTYSNSRADYFFDGISDSFPLDLSSTSAKIGAVAGGAVAYGLVALCVTNPLIGAVALLAIGTIGVVASGVVLLKNGYDILTTDDPSVKDDWYELGGAATNLTLSLATFGEGYILLAKHPLSIRFFARIPEVELPAPPAAPKLAPTVVVAPPLPSPIAPPSPRLPAPVAMTELVTTYPQPASMGSGIFRVYWKRPSGEMYYFTIDTTSGAITPIPGFKYPSAGESDVFVGVLNPNSGIRVSLPNGTKIIASEVMKPEATTHHHP